MTPYIQKLFQISKQVDIMLLSSQYRNAFEPAVTRLALTDSLKVVLSRPRQATGYKLLHFEVVFINLLALCYAHTISDMLERLVVSVLTSLYFLQQHKTCTEIANNWEQSMRTHVDKE